MKIDRPGVYDLTMDDYHGDCCIGPSMSSSDAINMIASCAAKAWHKSYMNNERDDAKKAIFDIGQAVHMLALEPGRVDDNFLLIEIEGKDGDLADSYTTKAAREARDAAYQSGKIPLLPSQYATVLTMVDALTRHPVVAEILAGEGENERSHISLDPLTKRIWMKARPDRVTTFRGQRVAIDIKTTTDATEEAFQRRLAQLAYFQQAAWYDEVLAALGRPVERFFFVVQEREAPYLVQVFDIDARAVEWGYVQNRKARIRWADCLESGIWPGYGDGISQLKLPSWTEFRLEEKLERDKERGETRHLKPIESQQDDALADLIEGRRDFSFGG